jgi:hypothetical protein
VTGHCGGVGPLQNERRDVSNTAVGKRRMMMVHLDWLTSYPKGMNSLKEGALWHVDPLLGNDHEVIKNTTAVIE